ncbi:hypothetical protein Sango_1995400 [Sesamum angolense]|uniref:Uncharacterized protein n=1 Tax=Sesamum angolense TaxID=2727404 RepID=A0AAE1WFM0_9LAMI|nr:hypothetical protein Sango_1995400 [Sesamum angolense]
MEMKNSCIGTLRLFFLLLLGAVPAFSIGRLHAKNMGTEIYDIDYRGPETHTYIPPPNRAGDHYQTSMARRRSKLRNDRPNGRKIEV